MSRFLARGRHAGAVDGLGEHVVDRRPAPARAAARRPAAARGRSAPGPAGRAGRPRARSGRRSAGRASGSSAAPSIASASSDSAPTGVFSSWPTLATKSRRTASTRRVSVTSCSTRATGPASGRCRCPAGTPCTPIRRAPEPARLPGSRTSARRLAGAHGPGRSSISSGTSSRVPRTMPSAAGGRVGQQHRVVGVDEHDGRVHEVEQPAASARLGQRGRRRRGGRRRPAPTGGGAATVAAAAPPRRRPTTRATSGLTTRC